jgi:hypothetical protein
MVELPQRPAGRRQINPRCEPREHAPAFLLEAGCTSKIVTSTVQNWHVICADHHVNRVNYEVKS